jgi:hypothetical protein
MGGAALASVVGAGKTVAGSAGAVGGYAIKSGKTVAVLGSKLTLLPGGNKIKSKLVDAARGKGEKVKEGVVRYFKLTPEVITTSVVIEETRKKIEVEKKDKKIKSVEIEVTGYEIEKVLRCETGSKKLDRVRFLPLGSFFTPYWRISL